MPIAAGVGVLALAALCMAVDYRYGEAGLIRLVGGFWLWVATWGIRAPSVAFRLGQYELANLRGWKKAWLLLPAAATGIALLVYAPGLA